MKDSKQRWHTSRKSKEKIMQVSDTYRLCPGHKIYMCKKCAVHNRHTIIIVITCNNVHNYWLIIILLTLFIYKLQLCSSFCHKCVYVHVVLCVSINNQQWIFNSKCFVFWLICKMHITVHPFIYCFTCSWKIYIKYTVFILSSEVSLCVCVCLSVCTCIYTETLLVIIIEAKRFCKQYFLFPN